MSALLHKRDPDLLNDLSQIDPLTEHGRLTAGLAVVGDEVPDRGLGNLKTSARLADPNA